MTEIGSSALVQREAVAIFVDALLIAVDWFFSIYVIQTGQVTTASLGYFILPVVAILRGLFI